jgi:Pyruvate/2-oxoacid:ferredoxin oxidoreductase delta subunit
LSSPEDQHDHDYTYTGHHDHQPVLISTISIKIQILTFQSQEMSTVNTLLALTQQFSGEVITLHPERCLNSRFRAVDCSLCADACPAEGAITVTGGRPALDNDACLYCGLCLHRCPTEAFTRQDAMPTKLIKTVATLSYGSVDLVCPQHPEPAYGPATQAVQTKRCLVALSPAELLGLTTQGREIWLDDTPCAKCPLGKVHTLIKQSVAEANSWSSLLEKTSSISLRTGQDEAPQANQRPIYDADQPSISRRDLFGSFKKMGQELAAIEKKVEMVKGGQSVPVLERLPQSLPRQRTEILSILDQGLLTTDNQLPVTNTYPSFSVADVQIDPTRCTACGHCARFCPTGALGFLNDDESFALTFQPSFCLGQDCNICDLACPEQAINTKAATPSSGILAKKSLTAGKLGPCQRCRQPIAKGSDLPDICFVCRSNRNLSSDLLSSRLSK